MQDTVYSQYVLSRPISPLGPRFNKNASNYEEVKFYYMNRAEQGLRDGVSFDSLTEYEWGCVATFSIPEDVIYYSVYIFLGHRRKGHFSNWLSENSEKPILTFAECKLEELLDRKGHPYRSEVPIHTTWIEYNIIQGFYGSHVANRTKVLYINHVEEGLFVMNYLGHSELAQRAYIMHPVFQTDGDFPDAWKRLNKKDDPIHEVDITVIVLAVEYRSTANGYLSFASPDEEPMLSPVEEVNQMLIADKVQNRKDFEIFHLHTHERSDRLQQYFKQWLEALGISEEHYSTIVKAMKDLLTPIEHRL